MKEIDFLPDWYKNSRRQQISYQAQYVVILSILLMMAGWSFYTARSVSNAQAQVQMESRNMEEIAKAQKEYEELEKKMKLLDEQRKLLDQLDTKFSPADMMAEFSHIIDECIVLTSVDLFNEPISFDQKSTFSVRSGRNAKDNVQPGRFKLVIRGLAADAANVADTIVKLERSDYFTQVIPGFTRSKTTGNYKASEFEISCYIANYSLE